jgi:hypothetical protein
MLILQKLGGLTTPPNTPLATALPKREFLRILRNVLVERSGIFQQTGKTGAYVLTHNAQKLQSHEYYMAGRALAITLILGGILRVFFQNQFIAI